MRVKPDQLPAQLDRSLAPVYLIAGVEPLLVQECRDQVIQAAQQQGFAERDTFMVEGRFDWSDVANTAGTLSLFSSRRILDIRIPTARPGREGARHLIELAADADPDNLLLVSAGDWGKAISSTKWAGELGSKGVVVEIWPIRPNELPAWINSRLQQVGLSAERDAVELIARLVEGNLLAAQQEIEKLALSGCKHRLTVDDVEAWVANSSRFDAFRLVECMLMGKLGDSLRVATGLNRTGTAIQLITGVLRNELELLSAGLAAGLAGEEQSQFLRRRRIWAARQVPLKKALNRLNEEQINRASITLALIDRQGKGMAAGDPWQSLDHLLCLLGGQQSAQG